MDLVNSKGKIKNGKSNGWYIWVKDDKESTGGYLVIQSPKMDFSGDGFDDWFATIEEAERFLKYKNWHIDWFE